MLTFMNTEYRHLRLLMHLSCMFLDAGSCCEKGEVRELWTSASVHQETLQKTELPCYILQLKLNLHLLLILALVYR